MKSLDRLYKCLLAIAGLLAVVGVLCYWIERCKAKRNALDAYLSQDSSSEEMQKVASAIADEEYLDQDFQEWTSVPQGESVIVSFLMDPTQASLFQEVLAKRGFSSTYDSNTNVLEAELTGPKDIEEIHEFEAVLRALLVETNCTYLGFAFV